MEEDKREGEKNGMKKDTEEVNLVRMTRAGDESNSAISLTSSPLNNLPRINTLKG